LPLFSGLKYGTARFSLIGVRAACRVRTLKAGGGGCRRGDDRMGWTI
jgi:hypothetical protein